VKKIQHKLSCLALAAAALGLSATAQAQTTATTSAPTSAPTSNMSGSTWYAPVGARYFGANVGQSDFGGTCGLGSFNCDTTESVYSLYTGAMWNRNFGLEFGMTDYGTIKRAGGNTQAYGFSAKIVGAVPLSNSVDAFAKLGTMYGRTRVTADGASGVATGSDSGWGSTYGLGLNFGITSQLAAVLEWDQSNLQFAGGREHINSTSLGLKYRF
jgi:OOP family OmpA-OmpF porin